MCGDIFYVLVGLYLRWSDMTGMEELVNIEFANNLFDMPLADVLMGNPDIHG